jgi:hypothetical protein
MVSVAAAATAATAATAVAGWAVTPPRLPTTLVAATGRGR